MAAIIAKFSEKVGKARADQMTLQSANRSLESSAFNTDDLAETQISVADISPKEFDELRQSPEHLVAEEMPLELIKPMSDDSDSSPILSTTASNNSWGVEAVGAHNSQFDGSGVPVAVLDTGIDKTHPAFDVPGLNIIERNFTTAPDGDQDGHGTHCAGTIFGRDVDGTRIGVAPGITQAFIAKVIPGNSSALVNALDWAFKQGARVASMSLGVDFPGFVKFLVDQRGYDLRAATSMALTEYRNNLAVVDAQLNMFSAREHAGMPGMIVVAATGNESRRNLPATSAYTIAASPPAAGIGIISVAALQQTSSDNVYDIAAFSNTDPVVAAPGVNVLSARASIGDLTPMNGTSMACPHVAGVAALYWQQALMGLGATPEAAMVSARIVANTRPTGHSPVDVGQGLIQAPQ